MTQTQLPRRSPSRSPSSSPAVVENLEERKLLAATFRVTHYFADNRGQAEIFFNKAAAPASLTRSTVNVFTAGADGTFGTADDGKLSRRGMKFSYANKRLLISSKLGTNVRYRVQLAGVRGASGEALDGEHNPGQWSGNGVAGGNFDMTTQVAANNRVRFATSLGFINVVLFKKDVPNTITNFKHYADEGSWDGTFFHRSVKTFKVIQGGGFNVVNGDEIGTVHAHEGIANEATRDNDKGTIAMANSGETNNSNTNQWYFNVIDNSTALDNRFSVFGVVMDTPSQTTIEAINNLTLLDADGGGPDPFGELPVRDPAAGVQRPVNIPGDLVVVSRVAIQMDGADTPGTGAAAASTASTAAVSRAQAANIPDAPPPASPTSGKRASRQRVFD
jgi:cyclophilin family peptidyl-prolyl cis-trans isomerase